jgi:hypothetical protein
MRKFKDAQQYAHYIKKIKFKGIMMADPQDQARRNEFMKDFYGQEPVNESMRSWKKATVRTFKITFVFLRLKQL